MKIQIVAPTGEKLYYQKCLEIIVVYHRLLLARKSVQQHHR